MYISNNSFPNNPVLGQSYVPIQYMSKTYQPSSGLDEGTIFPELVFPYSPYQSMEENKLLSNMTELRKENYNDK